MTVICLRMVHPSLNGAWMDVQAMPPEYISPDGRQTPLVTTGSVEWDGDQCAEVYVPENLLNEWRKKHPVDH
jgi:hypothetical protein